MTASARICCLWCKRSFSPKRPWQRACKPSCRQALYEWRRRAPAPKLNATLANTDGRCVNCRAQADVGPDGQCAACAEFEADRRKVEQTRVDPFDPAFDRLSADEWVVAA